MALRIQIACPSVVGRLGGNRVTAVRWAGILRGLGHRVRITSTEDPRFADLLIALHAVRSARVIRRCRAGGSARRVVLALTGTDLYGALPGSPVARRSLDLADRLVVLEPHARQRLPATVRRRVRVIHQSVTLRRPARRRVDPFRACVIGHLRPVKDPFRPALAVRQLPDASRIHVVHVGRAWSPGIARRARAEAERNRRYTWRGPRPRGATLRLLAGS